MVVGDVLDGLDRDWVVGLLAFAYSLVAGQLFLDSEVPLVACILRATRHYSRLDSLLICKVKAHVITISRAWILRTMSRLLYQHRHVRIDEESVRLVSDCVVELRRLERWDLGQIPDVLFKAIFADIRWTSLRMIGTYRSPVPESDSSAKKKTAA